MTMDDTCKELASRIDYLKAEVEHNRQVARYALVACFLLSAWSLYLHFRTPSKLIVRDGWGTTEITGQGIVLRDGHAIADLDADGLTVSSQEGFQSTVTPSGFRVGRDLDDPEIEIRGGHGDATLTLHTADKIENPQKKATYQIKGEDGQLTITQP
jgi:hypothetical protein